MINPKFHSRIQKLSSILGFLLFGAAIWVISREVDRIGWVAISQEFGKITRFDLVIAFLLTPVTYLVLSNYDVLAFRYIGHGLERKKVIFAALVGYAFANSISMTPSMAVRFRLYSHWGLTVGQISKIFFFHYLSTWLGFLTVSGFLLLFRPHSIPALPFLTLVERRWVGAGMFLLLFVYFLFTEASHKGSGIVQIRRFRVLRRIHFVPPSSKFLVLQVSLAILDWCLVSLILYTLLPSGLYHVSFFNFLAVFIFAQAVQTLSHVPGGIGVFEGTMLLVLKSKFSSSAILASLFVYRVIYMLIPLVIAAAALLFFELKNGLFHSIKTE